MLALPALALALRASAAEAGAGNGCLIEGGIAMYYAIIPAEMIVGHPQGHPEAEMHGGVPRGRNTQHLMVALFDAGSAERIVDAKVAATVAEIGLAGETKRLAPMEIEGAMTYGAYFQTPTGTLYNVSVTVERRGAQHPHTFKFEYRRR